MLDRLRALVPAPVKRPLRHALTVIDQTRRRYALARCVKELRKQASDGAIDPKLIVELRSAWGNEGFSADAEFLGAVASRMLASDGPFLECGSGVSTIIAGVLAEQRGTRLWSLEQDAVWYAQVARVLERFGIASVDFVLTPLKGFGTYAWYHGWARRLPDYFTHIFCDGPWLSPNEWSESVRANWRVGLVPSLAGAGVRFGEILLDDADDPRSLGVCSNWSASGVETSVVPTPTGPFILARPRSAAVREWAGAELADDAPRLGGSLEREPSSSTVRVSAAL